MSEHDNEPQLDFDMRELTAIVAILNAYMKHSLRTLHTLSFRKQIVEKRRLQRVETIKRKLSMQILKNNVGLFLTWTDLTDIIHAIKVYRGYVIAMFPVNEERERALATSYAWQQRFKVALARIHPET